MHDELQYPKSGQLRLWQAYFISLVATASTLAFRVAIDAPLGGRPTLVIFTLPIMLSAYLGGLRAGLLATALAFFGASYFLLPPINSFAIASSVERFQQFFMVLAGVFISVLCEGLHRARWRMDVAIHVHNQAVVALHDSEARLSGIVNSAMDAIITIDADQRIVLFNPAAEQVFGYASGEVLGQSIERLIPQRWRAGHAEHIRNFERTGMTTRRMGLLGAISGLRANGQEFPIEASISQVVIADQRLSTVILRDITVRMESDEALRQTQQDLESRVVERTELLEQANTELLLQKTILESQGNASLDGIMVVSPTGQMMSYNRRFVEMWNIPDEVVSTRSDAGALESVLNQLEDPQDFLNKVAYLYEHQDEESQEEILLTRGRIFDRYSAPVKGIDGINYGRIWFFHDITERKQFESALHQAREEAETANIAKSEFLSRMSHELRTPMNSILGFAQILEMSSTDAKQLQRVKHIMKAGRHLLQLINEVLDVARVESGQLSLSPEPISVESVIQMTVDLIRPLCEQNSLHLELELDGCNELYVQADQQRLSQVLLNLLANAAKYNRENGTVRVSCEVRGDQLRINVADTGYGIDNEHLDKLFQPFERLGREGGSIEGTGLGLTLSKRIMAAMGGTIGVESTVGTGSTFWIELPLVEGQQQRLNGHSTPTPRMAVSTDSRTILYIEDNSANFQVLEDLFESDPNVVLISAMQGLLGIELALHHLPSLILLDLHLPDIQGDEVLRRLRCEPTLHHIPVVMVSADATPAQITRLLAAGASDYLTKPLDLHEFLLVIHKYLAAK